MNGSYFLTSLFPPSTSPQLEAFFVIAHGVSGESYNVICFPTFESAGLKVMTPLIFIFITDSNVDTLSELYSQIFTVCTGFTLMKKNHFKCCVT